MRTITLTCFFVMVFFHCLSQTDGNVGINTTNPEQKLHLGGESATMRVDAFNAINSEYNGGGYNAPLYVDSDGVLTLEFEPIVASSDGDVFDGSVPSSNIFQSNTNQIVIKELYTFNITVPRSGYLEIKFGLSFTVTSNPQNIKIEDNLARIIQTYILLNNNPIRKYGMTSKCYINGSPDGITGVFYNNASTYIFLTPGTHTIHFYGGVGSESDANSTYVNFGVAQDMLLMRFY